MITIKCDNCERAIEVADEQAGTKVKCPYCGDVNIVPPKAAAVAAAVATAAPAKPDRAAAKGLPPAAGPEQTIIKAHPEMFRAKPSLYLFHVLVILGGIIGVVYFGAMKSNPVLMWACAGVGIVALGSFLVWKIKNRGNSLEITTRRSIERVGLFSKFSSEILHEDVRNLQITQSFRERLLGVGAIAISSAAQNEVEITVKDVRNPDRIREVIDLYRPM
jgi:phage FluMu protein Com